MITNTGKEIIAKYLLGTAPAYASYIALGCGAEPRPAINTISNVSSASTTFTVGGGGTTEGLWVGAKILISSGTGTLNATADTLVTAVTSSTQFTVNLAPSVALSSATISIMANPAKEVLDFEMFRIPITSQGYINDAGTNKIVLTAELPTEERYAITEVGIFSAGSNSLAGAQDSRVIYAFSEDEGWEYHGAGSAIDIPVVLTPLDSLGTDVIDVVFPVFETTADNSTFDEPDRLNRYEPPRFLNNTIMMVGNNANLGKSVNVTNAAGTGTVVTYTTALPHTLIPGDTITVTGVNPSAYNLSGITVATVPTNTTFTVNNAATGAYVSGGSIATTHLIVNSGSYHIHLTGANVNLDRNSPSDLIKLAFSVINKDGGSLDIPDTVRILLDFGSSDVAGEGEFARFEVDITNGTGVGQYDLTTNRYVVIEKQLQELYKSSGFTWEVVDVVKIYACVIDSGSPSSNFYISLDAIRLDNVGTPNPLYGMTGYSIVQDAVNTVPQPIIKNTNTTNFIEFRFGLEVS
jgi:hypothetical protein